ncbi:hypothetical protein ANCDUO_18180 [Ancylostoma duodenale]|uniref:Uncharacterized protein n=1 Tax=Ancylostoma duodenale TaxID=51022 RepID=A0A0C2C609_9BILA|nr:hypothetical protein ANCDUO_18180 [Ancylostoma duodenale]
MTWRVPSLTFDASPNSLSAVSPKLVVNMDGLDIITAIVWTWAAASFLFYLPFEFNFAQVFDEEARIELEDDPFENLLQMSHELKEDEVYECERRRQMLSERLLALKKSNPLMPR